MECKKECYWNFDGTCVYEDDLKYDEGKPEETENCPNWLRKDFEEHVWRTHDNIIELIKHRKLAELEAIEKFILSQRKDEK